MAEVISHDVFRLCRAMREMARAQAAMAQRRRRPPRLFDERGRLSRPQRKPGGDDPKHPPAA